MVRGRVARPARKPADRYHHGDLRRALLQAALRAIQRQGVEGLSLRAVGAELGVSRSALYRHFADKNALLAAVAAEGFGRLRRRLVEAWEGAGKGRPGFEAMGEAYVRFALDNPLEYRVMFGRGVERDAACQELAHEGQAAFAVLLEAVVEQQREGLVRGDDALLLAHFIWAQVHGIATLAMDGPLQKQGVDVEALTRFSVGRLSAAIAADARRLAAPERGEPAEPR